MIKYFKTLDLKIYFKFFPKIIQLNFNKGIQLFNNDSSSIKTKCFS